MSYEPRPCDPLPITDDLCGLQIGTMHTMLPTINPRITMMLKATMTDCGNAEEAYTALVAEVQRVYDLVKEVQE